jgi:hypothetical protein
VTAALIVALTASAVIGWREIRRLHRETARLWVELSRKADSRARRFKSAAERAEGVRS